MRAPACFAADTPPRRTAAASGDAPVADSSRQKAPVSQLGGWSEFSNTTAGLDLEAILNVGGSDAADGGATFYYTGTFTGPWDKSDSKVYLSNSEAGTCLVKVNGHIPPAGRITWDSESELSYDPPLLVAPRELKVGQEWDDRSALSGHSKIVSVQGVVSR